MYNSRNVLHFTFNKLKFGDQGVVINISKYHLHWCRGKKMLILESSCHCLKAPPPSEMVSSLVNKLVKSNTLEKENTFAVVLFIDFVKFSQKFACIKIKFWKDCVREFVFNNTNCQMVNLVNFYFHSIFCCSQKNIPKERSSHRRRCYKKVGVFLWILRNFKNTYFEEHLGAAAFEKRRYFSRTKSF